MAMQVTYNPNSQRYEVNFNGSWQPWNRPIADLVRLIDQGQATPIAFDQVPRTPDPTGPGSVQNAQNQGGERRGLAFSRRGMAARSSGQGAPTQQQAQDAQSDANAATPPPPGGLRGGVQAAQRQYRASLPPPISGPGPTAPNSDQGAFSNWALASGEHDPLGFDPNMPRTPGWQPPPLTAEGQTIPSMDPTLAAQQNNAVTGVTGGALPQLPPPLSQAGQAAADTTGRMVGADPNDRVAYWMEQLGRNPEAEQAAPGQPPLTEEEMYRRRIGYEGPRVGRNIERYAAGGPFDPPEAIVGEGMETETPQFDAPHRTELIIREADPDKDYGPFYKVSWAEGATGVQMSGDAFMAPLPSNNEEAAKRMFPPERGIKGVMQGETFKGGGMELPTMEPEPTPAFRHGGRRRVRRYESGGGWESYDPWAGLGDPRFGNWQQFNQTNNAQRERMDQALIASGELGGVQGLERTLQRSAPSSASLPVFMG